MKKPEWPRQVLISVATLEGDHLPSAGHVRFSGVGSREPWLNYRVVPVLEVGAEKPGAITDGATVAGKDVHWWAAEAERAHELLTETTGRLLERDGWVSVPLKPTKEIWKEVVHLDVWPVTPKSFERLYEAIARVARNAAGAEQPEPTMDAGCRAKSILAGAPSDAPAFEPITELQRFQARIDRMRADGLSDIKFSGPVATICTVEEFAKEANAMLDAIEAGRVRPLNFSDSKARGQVFDGNFFDAVNLSGVAGTVGKTEPPVLTDVVREPFGWYYDNPAFPIGKHQTLGINLGARRPDERASWKPLYVD